MNVNECQVRRRTRHDRITAAGDMVIYCAGHPAIYGRQPLWHNVLSPRAGRSKTREVIKYDPRNLSRVYWQDQQGNYWPIPYRNLALPPISLWEHDEALRRLKAESQRVVDEDKLVAMVLQQRHLVEEARSKTARRRRGRQPPNSECDLEAGAGQVRVTHGGVTAQPRKQETEIEELKEVAPFPVDIDP